MERRAATAWVEELHEVVEGLLRPLWERHRPRLRCGRGCSACCVDGFSVFEVEAEVIRSHHADVLATAPGPSSGCAFLDEAGACRIYAHRPYVCRTHGLPLRWATGGGEARDVCELNAERGLDVEELRAEDCWTLGPVEARLKAVQEAVDRAEGVPGPRRVALRSLFGARVTG